MANLSHEVGAGKVGRANLTIQQIMAWMNIGGMPHDKVIRSMRLFAERVLPAIG
jgi:hypothetical protein